MRRRRQPLQVSLFPFLAVLLCTLGALIFLLLVVDQKARQNAAAAAVQQAREAAGLRAAEIEQRVQVLVAQRVQLSQKAEALGRDHEANAALLQRQQAELEALRQRLQVDAGQTLHSEQSVHQYQGKVAAAVDQKAAVDSDLTRLQTQVQFMEGTVQRLRDEALRRQQQPLYSLVPYKGKHGTGRRPIYLECSAGQVAFRPDGGAVPASDVADGVRLRAEIQRRFAELPRTGDSDSPYVLLLVRPSGIPLYYGVIRALQGTSIDVGYEFIDEDWTLDFATPSGEPPATVLSARPETRQRPTPSFTTATTGEGAHGSAVTRDAAPSQRLADARAREMSDSRSSGTSSASPPALSQWRPPADGPALETPKPRGILAAPASASGALTAPLPAGIAAPGRAPTSLGENRSPGAPSPQADPPHRPDDGAGPRGCRLISRGIDGASPSGQPGSGTARPRETRASGGRAITPREWNIVIECSAAAIIVHPAKVKVDPAALTGGDNLLLQTVQDMIEQKRKKTADVQPRLKFVIRPDGLRAYYDAAAALHSLKLPAVWDLLADGLATDVVEGGRP